MRHGFGQYFMGTTFLYVTASALYRMTKAPLVTGGLAMWWGYLLSALRGVARYDDPHFRKILRKYQWDVLLLGRQRALDRIHEQFAEHWRTSRGKSVPSAVVTALTGRQFADSDPSTTV